MQKRLYMVTGVKVAYGAAVAEMARKGKRGKMSVGFDGAAAGVPFSFGPQVEASQGFEITTSFDSDEPFVFAYQLREIRYRKGAYTSKPYLDGALYGVGDGREGGAGENVAEVKEEAVFFLGLDEDDVTGDDVGLESFEVRDDGAEGGGEDGDDEDVCELIIPARGKDMSKDI